MDEEEENRKCRDAFRSTLRVLSEARRRDDDNLMAPREDNFFPLNEPDEDGMQLEPEEFNQVYNPLAQQLVSDYGVMLLQGNVLLSDSELYNDDMSQDHIHQAILAGRLHVPHIIGDTPSILGFTEAAHRNGGFGGVPASAAAIAGLRKEKYDGSGSDSCSGCVICMKDYKEGKSLLVMPCEHMHRFHSKCLNKWLSRSHLCPLCRYALHTTDEHDVRSGARSVPM